jgi:hypothetical protein
MAKQTGPFVFEGTVGDATGYKMNGKYYLKTKSEISRRRIREHRNFSLTRRNAKWFGEAVKLAQKIYYELDRCDRNQHKVWYPMRNRAQELVRKGTPEEEIIRLLREEFVTNREFSDCGLEPVVSLESLVVSRESSIVRREAEAMPQQDTELRVDELPDEIILGRVVNPGVELSLTDQLAASVAFVKNILREKRSYTGQRSQMSHTGHIRHRLRR